MSFDFSTLFPKQPEPEEVREETMSEFYARQVAETEAKYKGCLQARIDESKSFGMDNKDKSIYEQHLQTFIGLGIIGLVSWVAVEFNDVAVMTARMDERTQQSGVIAKELKETLDTYHETMVTKQEMRTTADAYIGQAEITHELMIEKVRAISVRVSQLEGRVFNK